MEWYEYVIIVVAVALVLAPIITHFVKKKKGTLKCECGHLQSECIGNCSACSLPNKKTKGGKKETLTYIVSVEGMKCGMCESHINDIIRKNFDVVKVKSSRKSKTTTIVARQLLNPSKIRTSISDAGYYVTSVRLK